LLRVKKHFKNYLIETKNYTHLYLTKIKNRFTKDKLTNGFKPGDNLVKITN